MKQFVKRRNKKILHKRHCYLCAKGIDYVDYKDTELLSKYMSPSCKIISRRASGLCQKHQRMITNAIKRARIVALLPFVNEND